MTDAPAVPSADRSVRRARPADASAIAGLTLAAWQARPAELLPPGALDGVSVDDLAADWREAIAAPPSVRHLVLAALDRDDVVGYALVAPAQDPDSATDVVELVDLVVRADRTRLGHGSRLLAAAVDTVRGSGATEILTWVDVTDDARRAFLASAGLAADGAHRTLDEGLGAPLRQVRWAARID